MSVLQELNALLENCGVPVETGVFSGKAPDEYIVLTPLADTFELYANDLPTAEIQEVRISLFSKSNYIKLKSQLVKYLLQAGFTITARRYIGFESDTDYHHCIIDIAKDCVLEEE